MIRVETRHIITKTKIITPKMRAAIAKQWPDVTRVVSGAPIGEGVFNVVVHYDDHCQAQEK